MKRRDFLVGVILLAALITGVVLTRGRGHDGATPLALEITAADGSFVLNGIDVAVTVTPRPLRVFAAHRYAFRFTRDGKPVAVTGARAEFDMTMDMGPHDYDLVAGEAGEWVAASVALPQCGSGSREWFCTLTFIAEGLSHRAQLRMELAPPPAD